MTFQKRLQKAMRDGNLTVADLARWFKRPDPTLRTWVNLGRNPSGPERDVKAIMKRLVALERAISKRGHAPMHSNGKERMQWLQRASP